MAPVPHQGPERPTEPGGPLRLSPADAAFIESSVSILAAAEGAERRPVMARAIAARLEPDTGRIRLCLRTVDAAALIAGALGHGRVAAMFSRPQTNETIQIKGDEVRAERPTAEDDAARRRYPPMMIAELMPLGFTPAFVGCVVSDHGSSIGVLSFMPRVLFDQTPGPQAGRPRECGR